MRWSPSSSEVEAAAADQSLRADVVGFRDAEQVDGSGCLGRCAAAAEWHHLLHRGEQARIHADLDLLACHVDSAVAVGGGFGEPGLDQTERHGVDGDVVATPLLG